MKFLPGLEDKPGSPNYPLIDPKYHLMAIRP